MAAVVEGVRCVVARVACGRVAVVEQGGVEWARLDVLALDVCGHRLALAMAVS